MADLMQFIICMALIFIAGIWVGATGLHAAQEEKRRQQLEQEFRDWERRHE